MQQNTGLFTVPMHTGVKCIQRLSETLDSLSSFTSFLTFFIMTGAVHNAYMKPSIHVCRCIYRYTWPFLAMLFCPLKHVLGCFHVAAMSHHHRGAFSWDCSWAWLFLLCLTGVCEGTVWAPCSARVCSIPCYCVPSSAVALALTVSTFSGKGFFSLLAF